MTRQRLLDFLETSPMGRQKADPATGKVPAYHFWMLLHDDDDNVDKVDNDDNDIDNGEHNPTPLIIAGGIGLRIGKTRDIQMYAGHIGYHVYPPARGHHYAERACRLLLPLARKHRINPLWITCNPDNLASRRTIERLGAEFVEIVPVPASHEMHARGEREKCRYRLTI
jgi:tagatose 1,6-diphosphate aldolase